MHGLEAKLSERIVCLMVNGYEIKTIEDILFVFEPHMTYTKHTRLSHRAEWVSNMSNWLEIRFDTGQVENFFTTTMIDTLTYERTVPTLASVIELLISWHLLFDNTRTFAISYGLRDTPARR